MSKAVHGEIAPQDHKANKDQRLIPSLCFYQLCCLKPKADFSFETTPEVDKPPERLTKATGGKKRKHCCFAQVSKDS